MPRAQVNGISLYYESAGNGYALTLTHGFSASHAMWKPQAQFAGEYRLITYDARGHGESDAPPTADQYSADIVVEDLFQLSKALGVSKGVYGGLSMGGYISLRFYLRHPEMVTALIVMDTGPGYRNPARMAEWNKTCEDRAVALETRGLSTLAAPGRREVALNHTPHGLAHMSRKVVAQHDSWVIENLAKISVPALVMVGENDTAFLQAADYMAKTIPGARKVVVPNAGHPANIDNPDFFNAALADYLRDLKPG